MDTKKDIGQYFNDNLNQMDFTPNDDSWNKIEEELNQKKRKKRVFFWLFFASFLSGCLLTLLLVYTTDLFEKNTKTIKIQNDSGTLTNSNGKLNTSSSNKITHENNSKNIKTETNHLKENTKKEISSIENELDENNISNKSEPNKTNRNNPKNNKKGISNFGSNYNFSNTKIENSSISYQKRKKIASRKKAVQQFENSISNTFSSPNFENSKDINIDKNLVAENTITKDTSNLVVNDVVVQDTMNLSSTLKEPVKKIKKLLEKDSTEVIPENKSNAFIVSPYLGYGLMNKNQVKGNFNASNSLNIPNLHFGLNLRWMVNKKYGLQIGFGYINASTKTEIEKTNSNNLSFNDVANNSTVTFPPSNKLTMTHDLSMYEIPLEFYYKLNDKKISFAMATGLSHTLIKDNTVYIESPSEKTKIGELESVLKQNFSANLKVYGTYKLSNKLQFEMYPSLQYQFLNQMKNKDLNPLILSIRAGLSYQF